MKASESYREVLLYHLIFAFLHAVERAYARMTGWFESFRHPAAHVRNTFTNFEQEERHGC